MTHPLPVGERKVQIVAKISIEIANVLSLDVPASFKVSAGVFAFFAFVNVDAFSVDAFVSGVALRLAWWRYFASKAAISVDASCSICAGMISGAFVNVGAANVVGIRGESVVALAVVVDQAVDAFSVFAANTGIDFALVVFDNAVGIAVAAVVIVALANSFDGALRVSSTIVGAVCGTELKSGRVR